MNSDHDWNRDADVDLGGIFRGIWTHKFKLLIISLLATALAFFVLQSVSSRYSAETRILIRAANNVLSTTAGNNTLPTDLDAQGIASQVQLLSSRSIAQTVIQKLDLKSKAEFGGKRSNSATSEILWLLGLKDRSKAVTSDDRVLDAFNDRLKIYQAEGARVVVVEFWSHDPEVAAAVPNMIAEEYIALQDGFKRGAGPEELAKLEPELRQLRQSVMKSESAVADFRASSDLLLGSNNTSLATQELSELATQLGRVRAQLSTAKANAAAVSRALRSGTLGNASSVQQSRLIQRLRERQVALNGQLTDLSVTLLSNHPRVISVRSQISSLNRQIASEGRKIERALQEDVKIAKKREDDLIAERNRLKSEAARVGKAEVELRALEREADAQRQLLNQYLVRFQDARSRQSRQFLPADAYIFSKAQVPSKPYFPQKLPTLVGVFFGTFVLGCMFVVAMGVLGGSAVQAQQSAIAVRSDSSGRIGSVSPWFAGEGQSLPEVELPALDEITTSTVVAAKSLSLLGKSRVAVLAPEAVGRSIGVVLLARELAANNVSVVVVDMTSNGDSSRLMLQGPGYKGITDVLSGTVSIAGALHRDRASEVHIMPRGNASARSAAQNAEQLPAVFELLQQAYDYVLIDCGGVDIGGLKRVSDDNTFNIVSAVNGDSPEVIQACRLLLDGGLGAPLIVELSKQEQSLAQNKVA